MRWGRILAVRGEVNRIKTLIIGQFGRLLAKDFDPPINRLLPIIGQNLSADTEIGRFFKKHDRSYTNLPYYFFNLPITRLLEFFSIFCLQMSRRTVWPCYNMWQADEGDHNGFD